MWEKNNSNNNNEELVETRESLEARFNDELENQNSTSVLYKIIVGGAILVSCAAGAYIISTGINNPKTKSENSQKISKQQSQDSFLTQLTASLSTTAQPNTESATSALTQPNTKPYSPETSVKPSIQTNSSNTDSDQTKTLDFLPKDKTEIIMPPPIGTNEESKEALKQKITDLENKIRELESDEEVQEAEPIGRPLKYDNKFLSIIETNDYLIKRLDMLEEKYKANDPFVKEVAIVKAQYKKLQDFMETTVKEDQSRINTLLGENDAAQIKSKVYQEHINKLVEEIENNQKANKALKEEMSKFQSKYDDQEKRYNDLKSKLDKGSKETIEQLTNELETTKKMYNEILDDFMKLKKNYQGLKENSSKPKKDTKESPIIPTP